MARRRDGERDDLPEPEVKTGKFEI